jgi:hypothetical protein
LLDVPTLKISEVMREGDWGVKKSFFYKVLLSLEALDWRAFEDSIDRKTLWS